MRVRTRVMRNNANGRSAHAVALESIGEAVAIVSSDNRIQYVNHACERMYGYYKAELVGQTVSIFLPPGDAAVDEEMIRAAPGEKWEGEVVRVRKGGERFSALMTLTLTRNEEQEVNRPGSCSSRHHPAQTRRGGATRVRAKLSAAGGASRRCLLLARNRRPDYRSEPARLR